MESDNFKMECPKCNKTDGMSVAAAPLGKIEVTCRHCRIYGPAFDTLKDAYAAFLKKWQNELVK